MKADWFLSRLAEWGDQPAIVANEHATSYADLRRRTQEWSERLGQRGVGPGVVVAIEGAFGARACAAFLAVMGLGGVVVPLTPLMRAHRDAFLAIAEVSLLVELSESGEPSLRELPNRAANPLTLKLVERGHPGLVIFSSGSTGSPKAILHDLSSILEKFRQRRQSKTTLTFLLFDHIGGVDTMLSTFGSGGCMVTVAERTPEQVAKAIERHRVHTLPTSPTFLNLLLISGLWAERDLSSLKVIAYGTEPMPASTLARLHEVFPNAALVQTYGMSELGVLRSRSRDSTSLWIKFAEEGFQTKVVDGVLWVKAETAMLGYLNAPDLFDADGWLNTQDAVEVDGDYLRILGRASDLINVGGQKVYPAEVENQLLGLENVEEVAVFGKPHPMMGQVVAARFNLKQPEPLDAFKRRMTAFCRQRLARYQIPVFVELARGDQFGARFKKLRQ
ncbi:MAG TPA: long-chain fatty acid--CoA ligase [Polyangiaceae bacterium]|nr:long-chain fatty acid--CoA ligase [Polyangiaceae bacterium]